MANNKRYYWIKLKRDFFSGMQQRKMRKQKNGELLLIIYLKLMLATCDSDGKFYYQGVFDDISVEIAETIVEDLDDVRNALDYFENNGLIELSPDVLFTPEVIACVGSECESAERVRNYREKQRMLHCNDEVTKCNTEKEKERDKEKEEEQRERVHPSGEQPPYPSFGGQSTVDSFVDSTVDTFAEYFKDHNRRYIDEYNNIR